MFLLFLEICLSFNIFFPVLININIKMTDCRSLAICDMNDYYEENLVVMISAVRKIAKKHFLDQ